MTNWTVIGVLTLALVSGAAWAADADVSWSVMGDGYVPQGITRGVATTASSQDTDANEYAFAVADGYGPRRVEHQTIPGVRQEATTACPRAAGETVAAAGVDGRWFVVGDGYAPWGRLHAAAPVADTRGAECSAQCHGDVASGPQEGATSQCHAATL